MPFNHTALRTNDDIRLKSKQMKTKTEHFKNKFSYKYYYNCASFQQIEMIFLICSPSMPVCQDSRRHPW